MDKFEVTLNIEAIRHTQASFIVYVKHGWRIIGMCILTIQAMEAGIKVNFL